MPDPIKSEETETRTLSLCLFGFTGITFLNRCDHCPSAARTPLNHRRCPFDASQPNIFHSPGAESKSRADINKGSASSSTLNEKSHDEAGTVLADSVAALSLEDGPQPAGAAARLVGSSNSVPVIRTPHDDIGVKRKAKLDADREARYKKKVLSTELQCCSVEKWMQEKPQRPLQDFGTENFSMPGCGRIPRDDMQRLTALMKSSGATSSATLSVMDTQREGHPSGKTAVFDLFIPGCILDTDLDGCGVHPCNDVIEIEGREALPWGDGMEIEEP